MSESQEEHNFYNRMNEIGEYNYNKRHDVIFIFQLTAQAQTVFLIIWIFLLIIQEII